MNKIFELKPSIKTVYESIILNLLFFMIVAIVFVVIKSSFAKIGLDISAITSCASIVLLLIVFFNVSKAAIKAYTLRYTLTDSSLIYQSGLLNLKSENLELFRVIDISLFRPIHHRMFGLADIVLHTIDKTNPTLVLIGVENFEEIESELKKYINMKRPNVIESVNTLSNVEVANDGDNN